MVRLFRYPFDRTDAPGVLRALLLPPLPKDGRRPKHCRCDLVEAICSVDCTGGAWRVLPVDVPPRQTVDGYIAGWQAAGVTTGLHDRLRGRLPSWGDATLT